MWACARYDLGVSEAEVWWLTPRQFAALAKRHHKGERRRDLRFGVVASVLANIHRDPKRKPNPFTPTDFFPDSEDASDPEELPALTMDALKAEFQMAGATVTHRSEDENGGD